jgi:hypothetical protein
VQAWLGSQPIKSIEIWKNMSQVAENNLYLIPHLPPPQFYTLNTDTSPSAKTGLLQVVNGMGTSTHAYKRLKNGWGTLRNALDTCPMSQKYQNKKKKKSSDIVDT